MTLILSALFIFALRLVDFTAATLRMLMVVNGRKALAWGFGFLQALVFVIAVREVLSDIGNWMNMLGYAAGFASGNVVGMLIEERLALGHIHMRIISSRRGTALTECLRTDGYGVTEIPARGKDGMVSLLSCSVRRKDVKSVMEMVTNVDPNAFITAERVRQVQKGFWRVKGV